MSKYENKQKRSLDQGQGPKINVSLIKIFWLRLASFIKQQHINVES